MNSPHRPSPGAAARHPFTRAAEPRLAIAHVLSSLGMGGQERVALELAAGQAARGHAPLVFSLAEAPGGPLAEEFRSAGVDVIHLAKRRRTDPGLVARLAAQLFRLDIDVVHTHNPQPLIYASLAARAAGAALVHTKHGINPTRGRQLWARRGSARLADAFVAVSDHTAEVARRARECGADRLRVVPNGIDLSRFGPDPGARAAVRDELGVPRASHLVGTVGRLFAEKGHAFLLRAAAPLLSERFHVAIVGGGPEARALRELAERLPSPTSVHLVGPRRDVPRILAALDTFALPSVHEGLPLVVPEAMAAALPVVASAVGGLPRVVDDGRTGYLIDYGDEPGLRHRLIELDGDPARARELGARGRERALAEFSAEAMVTRYMDIYRRALGSKIVPGAPEPRLRDVLPRARPRPLRYKGE